MNFPHLSSLLYTKPFQISFIAHIDALLILVLKMLPICPVNTCKLQHYLLRSGFLNCEEKNALKEFVVLNGRSELNVFNLEENKIIILPKVGKLSAYSNKALEGFKEINSDTGFFLPKEHEHRTLKTVHSQFYWALKLGWFCFFMYHCQHVLVTHHFSVQPCLKKK